jgi:hypothetical protein
MIGRCFTIYRNPRGQLITNQNGRATVSEPVVREQACSRDSVYGMAYQLSPETLTVTAPGEIIPVALSNNAVLNGVTHSTGDAEMVVGASGNYEIQFALYITADTANTATFSMQDDEESIDGGVWDIPLIAGYQIVTGFVMAHICKNSSIRIVVTAASPLVMRLTGSNTTASLSIKKL